MSAGRGLSATLPGVGWDSRSAVSDGRHSHRRYGRHGPDSTLLGGIDHIVAHLHPCTNRNGCPAFCGIAPGFMSGYVATTFALNASRVSPNADKSPSSCQPMATQLDSVGKVYRHRRSGPHECPKTLYLRSTHWHPPSSGIVFEPRNGFGRAINLNIAITLGVL